MESFVKGSALSLLQQILLKNTKLLTGHKVHIADVNTYDMP